MSGPTRARPTWPPRTAARSRAGECVGTDYAPRPALRALLFRTAPAAVQRRRRVARPTTRAGDVARSAPAARVEPRRRPRRRSGAAALHGGQDRVTVPRPGGPGVVVPDGGHDADLRASRGALPLEQPARSARPCSAGSVDLRLPQAGRNPARPGVVGHRRRCPMSDASSPCSSSCSRSPGPRRRAPTRNDRPSSLTAPGTARTSSAGTTRASAWSARATCAAAVAALPDGAAKRNAAQLLRSCRYHSIRTRSTRSTPVTPRSTCCRDLPRGEVRPRGAQRLPLAPEDPSTAPLLSSGTSEASPPRPRRREGGGERGDQPDRPVLRRPAPVRPQPQPDRAVRGSHAGRRQHPVQQQVLRHAAGRHRRDAGRRRRRQPLQQAQRHPRRPDGRVLPEQHDLPAGGVQLHLRARDRRLRPRPGDRARQRQYGILAFASDHGLIQDSEAYLQRRLRHLPRLRVGPQRGQPPTSGPPATPSRSGATPATTTRSATSGTAGNSIWAHDNEFFDNATGIATDSLFPGHPGLPQDHARWNRNDIHSNNSNWYTSFVDTGVCAKPMAQRGYLHGTICPVVPTPVGTGVLIAGATDRPTTTGSTTTGATAPCGSGSPAVLRDDYDPSHLYDTSNHNHTFENHMGIDPAGDSAPRHGPLVGRPGRGQLLEDNHYGSAGQTDNFTVDPPACADGLGVPPRRDDQDAGFPAAASTTATTHVEPPGRLHVVRRPSRATGHRHRPPESPTVLLAPLALSGCGGAGRRRVRRRWSRAA